MKTIIFLIILVQSILLSQMEEKTHYNSIANNLKFLKISESKVLLYGDNGVILRSEDAGESWEQNFTGTHSNILKLKNSNNMIYGINNNFEYMYSEDGGDYWKYKKTQFDFNDICTINENIIISTYSNKLYFTDIYGTNFVEKVTPVDSIFYVFSKNENLFIVNRKFQIFQSNDYGESWTEFKLNTVMGQFRYKEINNNLYLYGTNEIIKINEDLTLTNYVIGIKKQFEFYEYNEGFILINSSLTTLSITKYLYDISINSLTTIGNKKLISLSYDNYQLLDIIILNGNLFNSHNVKTLIKSKPLSNEYEIIMYIPYVPRYVKFFNNNEISMIQDYPVQSLYSNDGGKIFKLKESYIRDTISSKSGYDFYINDIFFFSKDIWYMLLNPETSNIPQSFAYYTTNRGGTYDTIPSFKDVSTRFIDFIDNSFYLQTYKNASNFININKLDLSSNKKVEINRLENTNRAVFHKLNEKEYLIFTSVGNTNSEELNIQILKTTDNFVNIELIEETGFIKNNRLNGIFRYNQNLLFVSTFQNKFYKVLMDELELFEIEDTTLSMISNINFSDIQPDYFENKTLTQTSATVTGDPQNGGFSYRIKSKYVNLEFNNDKFEIDTLGESTFGSSEYISEDGSTKFYYAPRHLYIPIEPERLEYYTSVVEKSTPSTIWIYPPYPNPVSNSVTIKFRTWEMHNIQNLKIELVEISSGKIFHIKDFNLSVNDKYSGSVNFDVGNINTGAFLINFKLSDSNKSESIIIE